MISLDSHSAKDDNIALVAPQPPLEGRTTLIPCESSSLTHTYLCTFWFPLFPLTPLHFYHTPGLLLQRSRSTPCALSPLPVSFPFDTLCRPLSFLSPPRTARSLLLSTIVDDDGRQSQRQTVLLMRVTRMMWLVVCSGAGDLRAQLESHGGGPRPDGSKSRLAHSYRGAAAARPPAR